LTARRVLALAAGALVLAGLRGVGAETPSLLGQPAPSFRLEDVGGRTLSLDDLRGRFVVVHFGASW
jgi:hypothetical protein